MTSPYAMRAECLNAFDQCAALEPDVVLAPVAHPLRAIRSPHGAPRFVLEGGDVDGMVRVVNANSFRHAPVGEARGAAASS